MEFEERARLAELCKKLDGTAADETKYKKPYPPPYEDDPEFLQYKQEFYRLRYEFFKKAPEPAGECACGEPAGQYVDAEGTPHYVCTEPMCDSCQDWAAWELRGELYRRLAENPNDDTPVKPDDSVNIRDFTIRVNIRATMEQINVDITQQVKSIMLQIQEAKTGTTLLRDWLRGETGKRRPGGAKDTFAQWRRCLDVYNRRENDEPWEGIALSLYSDYREGAQHGKTGVKPKGTLTRDARNDYEEAGRLIASALRGTFPN